MCILNNLYLQQTVISAVAVLSIPNWRPQILPVLEFVPRAAGATIAALAAVSAPGI